VEVVTVTDGAEARSDGEVVGRLVAEVSDDELRGRHAWSARDQHFAREPELYRDLYAVAGAVWLEQGATVHCAVIPAGEDVLRAWLAIAFAIEQVYAVRDLRDVERPRDPDGFTIRQGGVDDLDAAVRLAPLITENNVEPPVWSGVTRPTDDVYREGWREALADPAGTWFLAERDGEPLGGLLLWLDEGKPISLSVAMTLPEARGIGVGSALTEHAFWWARERGHEEMTADWRIANLLASRSTSACAPTGWSRA
jgi:ribosomal protein S18 acetylase RimI-like enzyme